MGSGDLTWGDELGKEKLGAAARSFDALGKVYIGTAVLQQLLRSKVGT